VFASKEKAIMMNAEQSKTRLELQKLMQDRDNLDYGKIQAILSRTSAVRNEMFIDGLKLREEISNVLTPEQREALKSKLKTGIRNRARDLRNRMQRRIPRAANRIRR
jgi:Spy/CpxP family protein refolding chaperone